MNKFLNQLTSVHLLELVNRYGVKAAYRNPQRRRFALIRTLRTFWSNNPVEDCAICLEQNSFDRVVITPCSHLFCDTCLISYIRNNESCPLCRNYCSYIDIISKLPKERFIQVRNLLQPKREIHTNEPIVNHINPVHLFISSTITIIVFLVNVFTVFLFVYIIISHVKSAELY